MTTEELAAVAAWHESGSHFDFRGHRIFYMREGGGTPLVCVHGFPTSSFDFWKIWPVLTARFDVVAPDMLGFGFSDKPSGHRYAIAEQADLVVALLSKLGLSEFHLLCHDYGVTVGQELLAREREGQLAGLRSICFLNGGLFPETHRPRPIQKLLASPLGPLLSRLSNERAFAKAMRAVFGPRTQPTDAELHAFFTMVERADGKRALAGLIRYMEERRKERSRWVSALVETRVPMRVINGVLDPVSGAHMVDRLLTLRPGTDVVRLDVGHYPQVEAPADVLGAYLEFSMQVEESREGDSGTTEKSV